MLSCGGIFLGGGGVLYVAASFHVDMELRVFWSIVYYLAGFSGVSVAVALPMGLAVTLEGGNDFGGVTHAER